MEWAGGVIECIFIANVQDHEPKEDVLNAAQSGAETSDLLQEANYFLQELNNSKVNIENDWKLINVFIGLSFSL